MVQSLHRDELPPRLATPEGPRLGGSGLVLFRISHTPAPLRKSLPDHHVTLPALLPEGRKEAARDAPEGSCLFGA